MPDGASGVIKVLEAVLDLVWKRFLGGSWIWSGSWRWRRICSWKCQLGVKKAAQERPRSSHDLNPENIFWKLFIPKTAAFVVSANTNYLALAVSKLIDLIGEL